MSKALKKGLSFMLCLTMLLGTFVSGKSSIKAEAATFSPRLEAPSYSTYYKPQSSYNPFTVNYNAYGGNCTWYAWGRAYEITGEYPKLGRGNAGTWWSYNKNGGYYSYGSTPKLGAVACWSNSGAGHVGIVEQINSDGTIIISESGWSSCYYRTVTIPSSGYRSGLTFQGYIYLGNFNLDTTCPTISNAYTSDISGASFKINCNLNDDVGVNKCWIVVYGPSSEKQYSVATTSGFFSHTINTIDYGGEGDYTVHLYAIDGAGNSTKIEFTNITAVTDISLPSATEQKISNISSDHFTVNCKLYDDVGIDRCWFVIYGPSCEKQYGVSASNGYFTHTINTSDFGGEGIYTVHVYVFDKSGNSIKLVFENIDVKDDNSAPMINYYKIINISSESFTITCNGEDNIGIVNYWIVVYGPSCEKQYRVSASNGLFSHTVNTSEYGGSGTYSVHIYAIDEAGNSTKVIFESFIALTDSISPIIDMVEISSITSKGFTINCTAHDNIRIESFWIVIYGPNGETQYRIETVDGVISHTIQTDNHGGPGIYEFHLYAMDTSNNSVKYVSEKISAIDSYTVFYNPNSGLNPPESQNGATSYIISSTQPTRDGYTFLGWSKDNAATTASYKAGDTITLTENTTLYAVWQKNYVDTPPVTENTATITIKNSNGSKTINYGETLHLTAITTDMPSNAKIKWSVEGEGVKLNPSPSGKTCKVTSTSTGNVVISAYIIDKNGNIITDENGKQISDSEYFYSDANLWLRIVYYFKLLFGISMNAIQSFKSII